MSLDSSSLVQRPRLFRNYTLAITNGLCTPPALSTRQGTASQRPGGEFCIRLVGLADKGLGQQGPRWGVLIPRRSPLASLMSTRELDQDQMVQRWVCHRGNSLMAVPASMPTRATSAAPGRSASVLSSEQILAPGNTIFRSV